MEFYEFTKYYLHCPDCSAEFTLDRILGEQALATLQSEVSNLSEKEIQKELVLSARPLLKMKKAR